MNSLLGLKLGETAIILSFRDEQTGCKLMSMGILPGTAVRLVRRAPFGGAVYIKADNQQFAIRNKEAECIMLE